MGTPPTRAQSRSRLALPGAARPPGRPRTARVLAAARRGRFIARPCLGARGHARAMCRRPLCRRPAGPAQPLHAHRPAPAPPGWRGAAGCAARSAGYGCSCALRKRCPGCCCCRPRGDTHKLPSGYSEVALACARPSLGVRCSASACVARAPSGLQRRRACCRGPDGAPRRAGRRLPREPSAKRDRQARAGRRRLMLPWPVLAGVLRRARLRSAVHALAWRALRAGARAA